MVKGGKLCSRGEMWGMEIEFLGIWYILVEKDNIFHLRLP